MIQSVFNLVPPPFYPGMITRDAKAATFGHFLNNAGDLPQINSATITYAANATYTVIVNGEDFIYTDPGTGSATTVRDALIAQINLSAQEIRAEAATASSFTITSADGVSATVSATSVGGASAIVIAQTQASARTSDVPLGLAVVSNPGFLDNQATLMGVAGHKFLGVTVDHNMLTRSTPWREDFEHHYKNVDIMLVMMSGGFCAVRVEEDVNPRSSVFYRYSGTGVLGAFRATTGAGADIQLMGARFTTTTSAGGVAELFLGAV